jgi:hypothetical protein
MKTVDPSSLGNVFYYASLIPLIYEKNPKQWRKVARMLNKARRIYWTFPSLSGEFPNKSEVKQYLKQAIRDTNIPLDVEYALKSGITSEFGF